MAHGKLIHVDELWYRMNKLWSCFYILLLFVTFNTHVSHVTKITLSCHRFLFSDNVPSRLVQFEKIQTSFKSMLDRGRVSIDVNEVGQFRRHFALGCTCRSVGINRIVLKRHVVRISPNNSSDCGWSAGFSARSEGTYTTSSGGPVCSSGNDHVCYSIGDVEFCKHASHLVKSSVYVRDVASSYRCRCYSLQFRSFSSILRSFSSLSHGF